MPNQQTPWVRHGALALSQGKSILLDTTEWFAWLEQGTSFCYSGAHPLIRLTVRREKRRQQFYWYAYCKWESKLHNIYLGKSQQLTQERLDHACLTIEQRIHKSQASILASS